jgi:hypothetical protein
MTIDTSHDAIKTRMIELDGVRLGVRERCDMQAVMDPMGLIDALSAERDSLLAAVERIIRSLNDISVELENRVRDFPGNTCGDIDRVIRDIKPIAREAQRRMATEDFADEVDTLLRGLPSDLDDLRDNNYRLRESLHEALKSRKDAAGMIRAAIAAIQPDALTGG